MTTPKLHEEVRAVQNWVALWRNDALRDSVIQRPRCDHTPHFLLLWPKGNYTGLGILIKRRDAVRSDVTQHEWRWLSRLERCGWCAMAVRGAHEAIHAFEDYEALPPDDGKLILRGETRDWLTPHH